MRGSASPIRIEEEWVKRAACPPTRTRIPAYAWDAEVDGESELQREVRQKIARHVCLNLCPVVRQCYEHATRSRRNRLSAGVRGGQALK